jgi:arsenate reductase
MAEGFLRNMAGDKYIVYSAGIKPAAINPLTIKVMNETGTDISKKFSKSVNEFLGKKFDYVVAVCDNARKAYPVFPGKSKNIN